MTGAKRRVAVTGIGLRTCLGNTLGEFTDRLLNGESGISVLTGSLDGFAGGQVNFDASQHFNKRELRKLDRVSQLAIVASDDAVQQSGLQVDDPYRFGVCMGTGMGGAETLEYSYGRNHGIHHGPKKLSIPMIMNHAAGAQVGIRHDALGECNTYTSACSSSSVAIGEACRRISDGYLDAVLAGGTESMILPIMLNEWNNLGILVRQQDGEFSPCMPFSEGRAGFHMSEGSCVVVLEEFDAAQKRGADILAEVIGYGLSNDGTHITKPSAEGQARAMRNAISDAKLSPSEIDTINAHGTATVAGDIVETEAIKSVFGTDATKTPISATKSSLGHSIGATGAIEFAICVATLKNETLPPTAFWRKADPKCDLDYVPNESRPLKGIRTIMSNSFAFGGCNSVLVLQAS